MKKIFLILTLIGTFIMINGCSKDDEPTLPPEESFLPMQIGNYWKIDERNFIEITNTIKIGGKLYYEFHSLTGGDMVGTNYLRIDKDQNLIESYPNNPDLKFLHAKFNAQLGNTFWTINNKSINDFKVTVTKKEDSIRTFEYQRIYHAYAKDKHIASYVKGLGWKEGFLHKNYKEIKINGNIFYF